MKVSVMPMLIAAALAAPICARAGGAITQARGVAGEPAGFDGARARPEADAVPAGSSADGRTAAQIAKDEQVKADARANLAAKAPGPDKEPEPPKPNEWLKRAHIFQGVKGGLIGLIIGSLWGVTGMGIGVLVGGLIGYALSRFAAKAA